MDREIVDHETLCRTRDRIALHGRHARRQEARGRALHLQFGARVNHCRTDAHVLRREIGQQ